MERFVEKPDVVTAARYLADGSYLWNSGIFVFRADVILEEIGRAMPVLGEQLEAIRKALGTPGYARTLKRVFPDCPSISIDYGVMEKSQRIAVVPADFGWSDVGSFAALSDVRPTDHLGNVAEGTRSSSTAGTTWCWPARRARWRSSASTTWWWSTPATPSWCAGATGPRTSARPSRSWAAGGARSCLALRRGEDRAARYSGRPPGCGMPARAGGRGLPRRPAGTTFRPPRTTMAKLSPTIFREYDIRGLVDQDLTEEAVHQVGKALGTRIREAGGRRAAVGWDCAPLRAALRARR